MANHDNPPQLSLWKNKRTSKLLLRTHNEWLFSLNSLDNNEIGMIAPVGMEQVTISRLLGDKELQIHSTFQLNHTA